MVKRSIPKSGGINRDKVYQEEFKQNNKKSKKADVEITQLTSNYNNGDITKNEFIKEVKTLLSKYRDLE